ncbi:MAG: hypothetical protein P8P36_06155 [Akkermansiaceae bacterium]|nr:hypothetical protein [Akkermansiaceae bacterium]
MIRFFICLLVPVSVLLASCGSTPEKRIERNPQLFQKLSSNEQKLVRAGKISQGMSKPAVFLAMGNPDHKTSGIQHGENFERWHYNTMVPVYSYGVSPYYRYNYGRYGCRRNYGGIGFQPKVHYVPRHGASVEFVKDEVAGWNRSGR